MRYLVVVVVVGRRSTMAPKASVRIALGELVRTWYLRVSVKTAISNG